MKKKEILEKAKVKHPIGEMESNKINKSCWIALIITAIFAITMMIVEGSLKHYSGIYALAATCFIWASGFYFLQYFVAKRKYFGIFLGGILEGCAAIGMIVLYILTNLGIM